MKYNELIERLQAIEKMTGLYLSDTCVDLENAGNNPSDEKLFAVAASAAGQRAEELGLDINTLLGFTVY